VVQRHGTVEFLLRCSVALDLEFYLAEPGELPAIILGGHRVKTFSRRTHNTGISVSTTVPMAE
jgi:hypothetical protein